MNRKLQKTLVVVSGVALVSLVLPVVAGEDWKRHHRDRERSHMMDKGGMGMMGGGMMGSGQGMGMMGGGMMGGMGMMGVGMGMQAMHALDLDREQVDKMAQATGSGPEAGRHQR